MFLTAAALSEFNTAKRAVPTSANTAPHIVIKPNVPKIRKIILMPIVKTMFCFTIAIVFCAILMAAGIFVSLSSIITTSAASIAASDPNAPIAIPTSALASTGASFIPSPTNITDLFVTLLLTISSSFATLSVGSSCVYILSIPILLATSFVGFSWSPVSIIIFFTSFFFFHIAFSVSGFSSSDSVIYPTNSPFFAI